MAETLHLQIVTPDRLLVREDCDQVQITGKNGELALIEILADEECDQVQIPGKNGELGILPGHAPLITELQIGEISYRAGATTQYLAVAWGFAEVLSDKVTILADSAERAEDIAVKRAQDAKARAEEVLRQAAADLDYDATLYALRRADVRLAVAARAGQTTGAH